MDNTELGIIHDAVCCYRNQRWVGFYYTHRSPGNFKQNCFVWKDWKISLPCGFPVFQFAHVSLRVLFLADRSGTWCGFLMLYPNFCWGNFLINMGVKRYNLNCQTLLINLRQSGCFSLTSLINNPLALIELLDLLTFFNFYGTFKYINLFRCLV